jgi:hypothetical protein
MPAVQEENKKQQDLEDTQDEKPKMGADEGGLRRGNWSAGLMTFAGRAAHRQAVL